MDMDIGEGANFAQALDLSESEEENELENLQEDFITGNGLVSSTAPPGSGPADLYAGRPRWRSYSNVSISVSRTVPYFHTARPC
jgi:hypothetical protein